MEKQINKRISELQAEMQMHQTRANQAQQVLNEESRQILAKQGAVLELQKLLDKKEEIKENPGIEKIEKL